MGNSNSLAHYTPDIEEKWHHSLPQPSYQQQIKVLPDLTETSRLRPTNNGVILHSGGTLTGRRESIGAIGSGVHRSRSISSPTHHHEMKYKPGALQRHHTQLEMVPSGRNYAAQEMNYKRFGSEPDLRFSEEELLNQNRNVQAKFPKGRKKKAPPNVPNRPGYEYDPSRFGWKPRQEIEQMPIPTPQLQHQQQPRKLRLFKTKAESSKKNGNPPKLATEASDMHFRKPFMDRRNKYLRDSRPAQDDINLRQPDFQASSAKSKIQLLPMPQYRREKSFDLSLLLSRKKEESKQGPPPNTFRKLSDGKEFDLKTTSKAKAAQSSSPLTKSKARRASQPPQVVGNDFQKELQEATRRRSMAVKLQTSEKSLKTTDVKSPAKENQGNHMPQKKMSPGIMEQKIVAKPKEQITIKVPAPETPIPKPPTQPNPPPAQPQTEKVAPKTFYFGMGDPQSSKLPDMNLEKVENEAIDIFAESILNLKRRPRLTDSSESAMSSDAEENMLQDLAKGDDETDGISLQLRPTLPKKQFEIPRFSPAAAWRMLTPANDPTEREFNPWKIEKPDNFSLSDRPPDTSSRNEERIERIYREPIPGLPDNKSGDSGISGDAGLLELTDTSPINVNSATNEEQKLGPFLSPWTPQQDLGEESSSDGDELKEKAQKDDIGQKHAFSLSLPRESSIYSDKVDKQSFNSLQRLRRTVSGAFNGNSDPGQMDISPYRNDNWFLSRSAPNSIEKNPLPSISDQEDIEKDIPPPMNIVPSMQPPSFSYLAGGKHFMYLPHRTVAKSDSVSEKTPPVKREEETSSNHRENLQDSPASWTPPVKTSKSKNHRFTFQSTVRQIERRRLAEKLSKEAEQKEAQRLSELEAMRRVEEEFQKKRAREKASIRQQLRMFSLEENSPNCTSLPPEWQVNTARADPDGAVSSPTPSPTAVEDSLENYERKRDARKLSDDMSIFMPPPMSRKPLHTEILNEMRLSSRRYFDYKPENSSYNGRSNHLPQIVGHIPARRDVDEAMRF